MNLYEYVVKTRKNDNESFEYLLEKFNPLILKYSNKLSNSSDAKSELMFHFIEILGKIPLENENFKEDKYIVSYICTSIHRYFCHMYAKYKKHLEHEIETEDFSQIDTGTTFNESNMIFYDLIKDLKPKEKLILEKKYIYNLTNSEIARSLNVSRQNIQACLNRSFKKLRNTL